MRKFVAVFVGAFVVTTAAYALDFSVSGEVKTGVYYEHRALQGKEPVEMAMIHNNDGDTGANEGRLRLLMGLEHENFGLRARYTQTDFKTESGQVDKFKIDFIYAYGNLFNKQLKISAGLLGESPWASGGPKILSEMETKSTGDNILGIRTEWTPAFLPGLNLGFVLNRYDNRVPMRPTDYAGRREKFFDVLLESVLGISYEHEYFALRFAYRLDTEADEGFDGHEGSRFLYRVEERALGKLLPGLQIWANGYMYGINSSGQEEKSQRIENWLYVQYDTVNFTANLNVMYTDTLINNGRFLLLEPDFTWKFFDDFLNVGLGAGMEMGFDKGNYFGHFYNYWYVGPHARINISSGLYVSAHYNYHAGSFLSTKAGSLVFLDQNTHWVNLRLSYTF